MKTTEIEKLTAVLQNMGHRVEWPQTGNLLLDGLVEVDGETVERIWAETDQIWTETDGVEAAEAVLLLGDADLARSARHEVATAANLSALLTVILNANLAAVAFEQRLEDLINFDNLPLFGGEEPADTEGIWSWDEKNLLTGDGWADLRIELRDGGTE